MGCPCRQIRNAISLLPGGKFFVGLLPSLPPGEHMVRMISPVGGRSFNLANGNSYTADAQGAVEVDPADVGEMGRLGCVEVPATTAEVAVAAAEAAVGEAKTEIAEAEADLSAAEAPQS
jgi:hypothetical protein